MTKYIEVQVSVTAAAVDRPFHYAIPPYQEKFIQPGMRIQVPFGHRQIEAFVLAFVDKPEVAVVKEIIKPLDVITYLTAELLDLSRWIGDYYLCSRAAVLQAMLPFPVGIRQKKVKFVQLSLNPKQLDESLILLESRAPRQVRVLNHLKKNSFQTLSRLLKETSADYAVIRAMQKKGYLHLVEGIIQRDPLKALSQSLKQDLVLTTEQSRSLEELYKTIEAGEKKNFLLHGVTGSGKTEIYLRSIEKVLQQGKGAIVMVPEISLTPLMIERFRSFFGNKVALLHSKLSRGERYDEWCRLLSGEARIAVGTRSAVFAPVSNLGIIILDEEHEWTYKQGETPRYHAAVVAEERARRNGAVLVLGSATPSLESYWKAVKKEYKLLELPWRVTGEKMPEVKILDMREELKAGNRKMFSRLLLSRLGETLNKGNKVLLFLNRRGHSTCVLCRGCGLVMRCPSCDISLTFHSHQPKLICHYCSYLIKVPQVCPACSSRYIRYFGTGTQKVEEEISKLFPETDLWRLDVDTTSRKDAHIKILRSFQKEGPGILIGTQMIAKGLDIAGITLVGVIIADTGLNLPDFRAGEKTFQLLTQVAGRAGRGKFPGEVIVQTYAPEHYSILAAQKHDFKGFFSQEIAMREELSYPPHSYMLRLLLTGKDEDILSEASQKLAEVTKNNLQVQCLGPAPCSFAKIKDNYRWHLVLKGNNREDLRSVARSGIEFIKKNYRHLSIIPDMEPLNML